MHRGTEERGRTDATPNGEPADPELLRTASTDIDESRDICSRWYFPIDLDVPGRRDRFAFELGVVRVGPLTIGALQFGTPVAIGATDLHAYHINLPVRGMLETHHSGTRMTATSGRAAVYRPVGHAYTRWSADCRIFAVKVEPTALENELELLLDRPVRRPLTMGAGFDVTSGPGRSWDTLIRMLHDEMEHRQGLIYHPMVAERLWRGALAGLLLAVQHPYRDYLARPAPPSAPRAVRRAVDAMESQPELPFTVGELAKVAGVSTRSLQEGFRRHIGVTPMTYLNQVRLGRVHEDLRYADPAQTTVATVAHRWGFTHLGRFANAYRAKYGTLPSTTLRRRP